MAHEIGQMFYYGERPWHGLGTALEQPATIDEALAAGGLDWEVELKPLALAGESESPAPHRRAVVRADRFPGEPGRVIGVVHPDFRPLQNREGAMLFDSLLGRGERVYHTGGYLRHGERVWLLARLPKEIVVGDRDVLEPYLLFSNSHDGSHPIDIRLTTIRVVCQNTLSLALVSKDKQKVFRRGHHHDHSVLRHEARGFFAFVTAQCEEAKRLFERLASRPCDAAAFARFIQTLMPDPARPVTAHENPTVRRAYETKLEGIRQTRAALGAIFEQGIPDKDVRPDAPNWWGAVNAVTAWVDHRQQILGDRYAHMLFGSGDRLKSAALAKALASV